MTLLDEVLAFPTLLFALPLAAAALYWSAVVLGVIGVDVLDGDSLDLPEDGPWVVVAERLSIGRTPITVTLSMLALFGFAASYFGMRVAGLLPVPRVIAVVVVLVVSLLVAGWVTGRVARRVSDALPSHVAENRAASIGRLCVVRSAKVDEAAGHGEVVDGRAGLLVAIRCSPPNSLRRGATAVIVAYDDNGGFYWVEALPEAGDTGEDEETKG